MSYILMIDHIFRSCSVELGDLTVWQRNIARYSVATFNRDWQ
jgi:hypothetical protein